MTVAENPALACGGVADDESSGTVETAGSETTDDNSTGNPTTTDGQSTTAGEAASEDGNTGSECTDDTDCTTDPARPFCGSAGDCVPCSGTPDGSASCLALDPDQPICADDRCLPCTAAQPGACTGTTTPICDVAGSRCICTEHEQCGTGEEAACHIEAGTCFPSDADRIHHVHADGEEEFTTITDALLAAAEGEQAVVVLHGSDSSFDEAVTLAGNRVVALKLASDADVQWIQSNLDDAPTLTLSEGAIAYLDDVRLRGNLQASVPALAVQGATVYLRGGDISANSGSAIVADNATVVVQGSRIVRNGGGISATGGSSVTLTNVFASGPLNENAVNIEGSTFTAVYSTLGNATFNDDAALRCDEFSTVALRNDVVVSQGGASAIECASATIVTSALADDTSVPPFDDDWFADYNDDDFHLDPSHPFAGLAEWQAGDPLIDIDGEPRITVPGTLDTAGADLPVGP